MTYWQQLNITLYETVLFQDPLYQVLQMEHPPQQHLLGWGIIKNSKFDPLETHTDVELQYYLGGKVICWG